MTDQELISEVLKDSAFPKRHLNEHCYVKNGRVHQDFTNSDGKKMRRYFYFGKYNLDGKYVEPPFERGEVKVLIWGGEFINMVDKLECLMKNGNGKILTETYSNEPIGDSAYGYYSESGRGEEVNQ